MYIAIFWFNIVSFTLLFGAAGLSYILHKKTGDRIRYVYQWYVGIFAFWQLSMTYLYSFHILIDQGPPIPLLRVFTLIRGIVSVIMLYMTPLLLFHLLRTDSSGSSEITKRDRMLCLVSALLVAVSIFSYQIFESVTAGALASIFFNMLLGVLFLLTLFHVRKKDEINPARQFIPFLWISGTAFSLFGFYNIVFWIRPLDHQFVFDVFFTGLFVFVWAVTDLFVFMNELTRSFGTDRQHQSASASAVLGADAAAGKNEGIPQHFIESCGITRREKEIIELMLKGFSYREIGEFLSISARTVESHAYSIFRKCGASNKIELIHIMRSEQH